jgi:hypothetical protein
MVLEWTRASIEYPPLTGYVPMQTWSVKNMVQDINCSRSKHSSYIRYVTLGFDVSNKAAAAG